MAAEPPDSPKAQARHQALERYEKVETRLAGWLMGGNMGAGTATLALIGGFVTKPAVEIPWLLALLFTLFVAGIFGAWLGMVAEVMLHGRILGIVSRGLAMSLQGNLSTDREDKVLASVKRVRHFGLSISSLSLSIGGSIALWQIWRHAV